MAERIRLKVQEQQGQPVQMTVEEARIIKAISPEATVERIEGGVRFTVTDYEGTTSEVILDGEPGEPGEPGKPGPKGDPGNPAELIDDTSTTATDKVWSASKTAGEVSDLNQAINQKYTKPNDGIPASDLASGVIPSVPVQDVQVNGTSILSQGVANVPIANTTNPGAVQMASGYGIYNDITSSTKGLRVQKADSNLVKAGTHDFRPIVPSIQDQSVFYGLAKASGDTSQASSSNAVGTYTDAAKIAIQKMLGIYEAPWELIREDTVTNATEADIEITVDGNGNAFELTDAILMFETPVQETASAKGDYGIFKFYYKNTNEFIYTPCGTWTQAANAAATGIRATIRYEDGIVMAEWRNSGTSGNAMNIRAGYKAGFTGSAEDIQAISDFYIHKINITKVTGTGHYILYGKRKWTT